MGGEEVTITTTDGVKVNDANVVIADVETDNGVIHTIDAVIVPPSIDVAAFLETCPPAETEPAAPAESDVDVEMTESDSDSGASALSATVAMGCRRCLRAFVNNGQSCGRALVVGSFKGGDLAKNSRSILHMSKQSTVPLWNDDSLDFGRARSICG